MSYYDNQQWTSSGPQVWEQQTPPARSGASSAVPREDSNAFATQIEEVDRAVDNLVKSGKMFNTSGRRESMPVVGCLPRAYIEPSLDPRMGGGPPRHHSISEFGDNRSFSASNLQNFYASQRHQPSRGTNEAEQVMQAKRRMAAQRERELRNYHQEQQYNRSVTAEITTFTSKADRNISPSAGMKDEDRIELINRQRSTIYTDGPSFASDGGFEEAAGRSQCNTQPGNGLRGHSPRAYEQIKTHAMSENGQSQGEPQLVNTQVSGQQKSRANSVSSPSHAPGSYSIFDSNNQQSNRTSTSSPVESPRPGGKQSSSSGVAPIGTRPSGQTMNTAHGKRSTTPLPSPLSYGFAANEASKSELEAQHGNATSNQNGQGQQELGLGWGKSSVWGNKSSLGVQAPVWG
ncbi:hypothetical protein BGHDH14_bgh02163 [Blumeria hordei DH14]|uniref:Uncharacterized protein n=1 Tax=Blumeria graminis f. sp. hordei (strain DH14) TaxID=546991 RepID=N1JD09_BLUG1|nr:hypothetical protein BGHDH14_bgh02163 [Blumeria hordei DH14]